MATTNYDDTGRDAFFAICQPRIDHLAPNTPFTLPELLDDRRAHFTRNT